MCIRVRAYARMREVPKGTIQYLRNLHYRYCIVNSTPRFYIGFVTLMSTMSENGMNYLELCRIHGSMQYEIHIEDMNLGKRMVRARVCVMRVHRACFYTGSYNESEGK